MKEWRENSIKLGVCYYPEHWPEDFWEDDYTRMRELGFTHVRLAEFAWTIFEPEEGTFTFELFDRAIDLANKLELKVILGTPTATPPAWLTHNYPEVLNVTQEGVQYQHGMRRHYNYNSSKYRELSARIVRELVNHYKDHPAVVGWQIDNELNCETNVFYSQADQMAFKKWVKEKYETLQELNDAWGTVFWNQTYTHWNQISLTGPTVSNSPNPHQALDEKRFFSDSAISFAKLQSDIIRERTSNQWVTTNGKFGHLDNHKLTEETLDFYAYDSYPNFSTIIPDETDKPLLDRKWSFHLSTVRNISSNFAVFEQQSGAGGWVNRIEQPSPKPGQMRLWTYQSIAHGADMVLYFRWRTATKGSEIYWHGINDYHNQPNRRVEEVKKIGQEINEIGSDLVGSKYVAQAAIVTDYDNEWDGELDNWHGPYSKQSQESWFKAFQYNHIPVDSLHLLSTTTLNQLSDYQVLIYPHPAILTDSTAKLLKAYVEQGGEIVFGCRTGYKDIHGQTYMLPFPGKAVDIVGTTVEDFTRIGELQKTPTIKWKGSNLEIKAEGFNEVLNISNGETKILADYKGTYYEGKPALIKNRLGKGFSYYFGGVFNLEIASTLLQDLNVEPIDGEIDLPESVEIAVREKSGIYYVFLLNYSPLQQEVNFKTEMNEMINGITLKNKVPMQPYDVWLIKR